MRNFSDTVPLKHKEITPEQADKLIRESWPRPHLVYPAEASTEIGADDVTDGLPGAPMTALLAVGLITFAAALVAALVIVVFGQLFPY